MAVQPYSQTFTQAVVPGQHIDGKTPPCELNDFIAGLPELHPEGEVRVVPFFFLGMVGGQWMWLVAYIIISN